MVHPLRTIKGVSYRGVVGEGGFLSAIDMYPPSHILYTHTHTHTQPQGEKLL